MAWDYTNDYGSTLSAGYTSGGTSLSVTSATGLPASGRKFIVKVGNEYFLCTSYSGTTLTVAGAQAGSSASNHSIGDAISGCWIVPDVLDGIRADQMQVGIYSSLPASGMKQGDRYRATDVPYDLVYDGSVWQAFCGQIGHAVPPNASSFSGVNSATASWGRSGYATVSAVNASHSLKIMVKSVPTTPYTITAYVLPHVAETNYTSVGLVWRESASGKLIVFGPAYVNGDFLSGDSYSSPTSYNGNYVRVATNFPGLMHGIYLRMTDDGTTRSALYSYDGVDFFSLMSAARTDWITADQVGFYADSCSSVLASIGVLSWEE